MLGHWSYEGADPSILLFDYAIRRWRMPVAGRLVELGCCETDFLERVADIASRQSSPITSITGIDQRFRDYRGLPTGSVLRGDILDPALSLPRCDWLISLGTVEHIGLGYYGDRADGDGDRLALQRFADAGCNHLYFDVPWTPGEFFVSSDRHWRCYDDAALRERLVPPGFVLRGLAYAHCDPIRIIDRPSAPPDPHPFYYAVLWIERPNKDMEDRP